MSVSVKDLRVNHRLMRGWASSFVLLIALFGSNAVAMSSEAEVARECRVTAGSKLPAEINKALCTEVTSAIAKAMPGSRFSVEITAISPSRLAAEMTVNGRVLPKQNFAVMDNQIDQDSIRRFAQSLGEIAKASKR